ncbi:hypothetical protein [Streptomyces sp. SAS_272]|uniref:hypothetical protein n=1 Tax=Streptomyces sp. SAS_272 TaxID=3412747 RepID=UPI00403D2F2D
MSTTTKHRRRNQDPEPVRPRFARLFRRRTPSASAFAPTPPRTDGEHILRLTQDLNAALAEAAQWKRHADSFEQDRESAVEALLGCIAQRDGAYSERAKLLAWITALHPATSVITQSPDADEVGWQLLYLVAGGWQMSWHIHPRDADLFKHVTVVDVTDPRAQWDGHGTVQKYERIRGHVRLLALDNLGADGASTAVTAEQRSA